MLMNINEYFNFNNVIIAIIAFFYEIIFMSNILQTPFQIKQSMEIDR